MSEIQAQPAWKCPFPEKNLVETRTFKWELNNDGITSANKLQQSGKQDRNSFVTFRRFRFEAGYSLGFPSKWSLFVISCGNPPDSIQQQQVVEQEKSTKDYFGIFLDSFEDPESSNILLELNEQSSEYLVRACVEVVTRDGETSLVSKDIETTARKLISKGHWGWKKVSSFLMNFLLSPTNPPSADVDLKLDFKMKFSLVKRKKELLTKVPSSDVNLLAKRQEEEGEIAAIFYKFARKSRRGRGPDFFIEIVGSDLRGFWVHKEILAARSPVFGRMLETSMKEKSLAKVSIGDVSYGTMDRILRYIYLGQVELEWLNSPKSAAELVYASTKYWLAPLKNFCDKFLVRAATRKNCLQLLELASLHDLREATDQLTTFVHDKMNAQLEEGFYHGLDTGNGDEDLIY